MKGSKMHGAMYAKGSKKGSMSTGHKSMKGYAKPKSKKRSVSK